MGALLHHLCVLKSVDELELLALHALHVQLMLGLLHLLTGELLLQGHPHAVLPIHLVHLALLRRLLLLGLNQHLLRASAFLLLRPLLLVAHPS